MVPPEQVNGGGDPENILPGPGLVKSDAPSPIRSEIQPKAEETDEIGHLCSTIGLASGVDHSRLETREGATSRAMIVVCRAGP